MRIILAVQSLIGTTAIAAPCTTSTLAAYVGLGAAGCTIGSFRFSDFALLTSPTGSIPFTSIGVLPVSGTPGVIGLDFRVGASAGPGVFFDNLISYRVTGIGASINGASLFITGCSSSGHGAVTTVENLCVAGLFTGADGVSGCSGTQRDQIVVDVGGSADPPVSLGFLSAAALAVVTDIGVDGGTDGTGALAFASNRFLVAPGRGCSARACVGVADGGRFVRALRISQGATHAGSKASLNPVDEIAGFFTFELPFIR